MISVYRSAEILPGSKARGGGKHLLKNAASETVHFTQGSDRVLQRSGKELGERGKEAEPQEDPKDLPQSSAIMLT